VGGWNKNRISEACVIAFWRDEDSYQSFMENSHDYIFEKSRQRNTYDDISVSIYKNILDIQGTFPNIIDCLGKGKLLCVVECIVHPGKERHFEEMLKHVWKKEMSNCTGMLAGAFTKNKKEETRYLIASLWENHNVHEQYAENIVPSLRNQSQIRGDIIQIRGVAVDLEDSWLVVR
jgi:heme-degrading monooxygenase HmoA